MNGGFDQRDVQAFSDAFGLTEPKDGKMRHAVHWPGEGRSISCATIESVGSMCELIFDVNDSDALASLYAHLPNGWSELSPRNELYTLFNPGSLGDTIQHAKAMLQIPEVHSESTDLTFAPTNS